MWCTASRWHTQWKISCATNTPWESGEWLLVHITTKSQLASYISRHGVDRISRITHAGWLVPSFKKADRVTMFAARLLAFPQWISLKVRWLGWRVWSQCNRKFLVFRSNVEIQARDHRGATLCSRSVRAQGLSIFAFNDLSESGGGGRPCDYRYGESGWDYFRWMKSRSRGRERVRTGAEPIRDQPLEDFAKKFKCVNFSRS